MVNQSDLVLTATEAIRSRAALDDCDIPDPYGRGDEAHLVAAQSMAAAVDRIAKGLAR